MKINQNNSIRAWRDNILNNSNPNSYPGWHSFIQFTFISCIFAIILLLIWWLILHLISTKNYLTLFTKAQNWSDLSEIIFYFEIILFIFLCITYHYYFDLFSLMTNNVFRYFSQFSSNRSGIPTLLTYLGNLNNTLSNYIYEIDSKHYKLFQYYYPQHSSYFWGLSVWFHPSNIFTILREYVFYFIGWYTHFTCVKICNFFEFFIAKVFVDLWRLDMLPSFPKKIEMLGYKICFIFSFYIFTKLNTKLWSLTCPYIIKKCHFFANFYIKRQLFYCFFLCFFLCSNILHTWFLSLFVCLTFYNLVELLFQLRVFSYEQFHKIRCMLLIGIVMGSISTHTSITIINLIVMTSELLIYEPTFIKLRVSTTPWHNFLLHYFGTLIYLVFFLGILKHIILSEWKKVAHVKINHLKITKVMYAIFYIYILKQLYLFTSILMLLYTDSHAFYECILYIFAMHSYFYVFWVSNWEIVYFFEKKNISQFFEKNKQKTKPYSNYTIVFIIIIILLFYYIGTTPIL